MDIKMNKHDKEMLAQIENKMRSGLTSYEEFEILESQKANIINSTYPMKKAKKVNKLKKAVTAKSKKALKAKKK